MLYVTILVLARTSTGGQFPPESVQSAELLANTLGNPKDLPSGVFPLLTP